jgi:L-ascorbate metabolism protein UlaG (beta-lactamase superfamily)
MQIGDFNVGYLSHVSFLFRSSGGTTILTDPLFMKSFMWNGHIESYLSPPDISPEDITHCNAIFISHIHGDHCDHNAVRNIHERTKARILAPDDVLESLAGISGEYLIHVDDGVDVKIGDVTITPLAGYDNSFDGKGRPNKFAMIIKSDATSLFYSGDCHEVPPKLKGKSVDAIFLWPHPQDERLIQFHKDVSFSRFIMMHGDRFKPGDFMCNLDYEKEKERLHKLLPDVEVIIPKRIKR